ncbi:MAG: SGNH/GDSL hydrolase family protein [Gammaproteobacteria bacterium]|nr:SGNH/GDSL hydrolase family protein [Gammaproteobacteria bacterium]
MDIKEIFKGLAAAFISLLIFLILLEVTLQIYTRMYIYYDVEMSRYAVEIKDKSDNPLIGHEHTPNSSAYLMGVDVDINSDGFRDVEHSVERNQDYRIAVLGDSLTFGWGVEVEDTFVVLLEEMLSEKRPTEMINFGHGNYNTQQQVNLFKEKGLKYNPDKVVVFYFINDAEVTPVRSNWLWISRLRSVTFLWSRFRGLLSRAAPGQTFETFYSDLYEDSQPGFIAVKESFLQLQGITEEHGIELQVVMLPELHDLVNYPFTAEYAKVKTFLRANDISVIDLTSSFAGYEDPASLWVAPDDAHPNALAHKMIAEYSRTFLEQGGAINE